jgi:hypothetical protein
LEEKRMMRYFACGLVVLTTALFAVGCGGANEDASGGDTVDRDAATARDAEDTAAGGVTNESAGSLDPAVGEAAADANGPEANGKKSVVKALFDSVYRGAAGASED